MQRLGASRQKNARKPETHFRAGHYHKVIEEYDGAIKSMVLVPHSCQLWAAAWFKLEEYDAAERCANRALVLDPRFKKARYRCGLAREGNLELAQAAIGI